MTFLINPYRFGRLWTPADIATALWLDAADASTVTTVSGAVSQWNDKSENGRNAAQATSTKRPLYEQNQFNNLPAIRADGVDDVLTIASTPMYNQSSFYIHAVMKRLETESGIIVGNRDFITGPGLVGFEFSFFQNTSVYGMNPSSITILNGAGAQNSVRSSPTNSFANGLYAQPAVQWQTGATPSVWIDGTTQPLTPWTANPVSTTQAWASPDPGLGIFESRTSYSTSPAQMQLCEIVIVNSVLSSTNRQKLEGYLAWKWGLTASLPAGHPYKSTAPTV